jgi:hypothetical protein
MPSNCHQWLLLWVARKMTADGFVLGGYEGPTPQGGLWNALPQPFQIHRVRPDAWGVRPLSFELAIGEAKTSRDVGTEHTRAQFLIFGRLLQRGSSKPCQLYVAVPHSAATALYRVLAQTRLLGRPNVSCLIVPDCLLPEVSHERP